MFPVYGLDTGCWLRCDLVPAGLITNVSASDRAVKQDL
jgi:hypothetical protein